jgi:hypothetical protein
VLPKTPVVCKPFQDAFEKVFKMIDVDPHRTVRFYPSLIIYFLIIRYVVKNQIMYYSFIYFAFCCSCSSMTVSVIYRQENP